MMTVYVKAVGGLAERMPDGSCVSLQQGANLLDLLNKIGIKSDEVMLAFINNSIASPSSMLTPECQIHLSPFICGG